MINYKKKFIDDGFLVFKKFIDKKFVIKILEEIKKAKKVDIYYDKKNKLRRIERIYNKGHHLNILNKKIELFLKEIFKKKFYIFKDKYNAKPPKGEGFYAHYDGVFYFTNKKKQLKKGWYEYSKTFISILIALDVSNKTNGTIEIAKKHNGKFEKLLKNTNNDGTPNIKKEIEKKTRFKSINLKVGDIVAFTNTCPHRSKKNHSNSHRRALYYTYSSGSEGSQYKKYFTDKKNSINTTSKSL